MHLFGEELREFNVLAIIHLYNDPLTTYSQALEGYFNVLLRGTPLAELATDRPRVCLYVNKRLDATKWEVHHHSRDLSSLALHTHLGPVHLHCAYNPGVSSGEASVIEALQTAIARLSGQHIASPWETSTCTTCSGRRRCTPGGSTRKPQRSLASWIPTICSFCCSPLVRSHTRPGAPPRPFTWSGPHRSWLSACPDVWPAGNGGSGRTMCQSIPNLTSP